MTIVVLIKQVPLTSEVALDPKTGVIQRESGETKMNPYDLYALETALRIVQAHGGKTIALTMGPPQAETVVREAFAMGFDEGYLLTDRAFAGSDVLATSHALSQAIRTLGHVDLIITGKQTTDGDTGQVGAEVSEFLNIPCVAAVQQLLEISETSITAMSDTGTTLMTVHVELPALIAVDKDIHQPRLPSYVRMKQTEKRQVRRITLADLPDTDRTHYGLEGSPTQVVKIFPPESNTDSESWTGENIPERLYRYLQKEKFLQELA
jgi:electron transfer flavoprotein beta subunit